MRAIISKTLLAAAIVFCLILAAPGRPALAKGGLTLTPATLTLSLAKGSSQQTAEFTITNSYDKLVSLNFAFGSAAGTPNNTDPAEHLHIRQNHVMLGAGESLRQTITLKDSDKLGPGSLLADLVITQAYSGAGEVGVLPSIRMPLVLVKEDGAVSALALAKLAGPGFSLLMPSSVTATIRNSGNMIAIPRGLVTITGPGGQAVYSGALNTSSLAVSPGDSLALATPLNRLKNSPWPGIYRVNLSYGLGGGQRAQSASTSFFYIAWWHIAILAAVGTALWFGKKQFTSSLRKFPRTHHPPPKRSLLIGRDIT